MTESTYDRGERPCIACKAGAGVSDAFLLPGWSFDRFGLVHHALKSRVGTGKGNQESAGRIAMLLGASASCMRALGAPIL
jgi:hypothetical protein